MHPHPERIGRYRLLAPVGVGGMATVYLARQEGMGGFERDVALKLLHPHLASTPAARADFVEEARLAASIRHPNVAAVLDVGEQPPSVYLVMEYVEGDSLAALLAGGPISRPIALRILLDALAGLHAAHELCDAAGSPVGLVHRDFSPQNVLVGADGQSRLTDFGIAKAKSRAAHTAPGLVKGKLRYMSPEQAQGKPLDRRSDVWAAGVVAWELMTGKRLFGDDDEVKTILRILSGDPPTLASTGAEVPAAMSEAVAGALRRNLAARTATAAELRARIAAAWEESSAGRGAYAQPSIASHEDVARWVHEHAADAISSRRAPRVVPAASGNALGATAAHRGTSGARDPVTKTSSSADVRPAAATSGRARLLAAALLAVGVAGGYLMLSGGKALEPASAAPDATEQEATPAAPETLAPASPAPEAAATSRAAIDVRADADLAEVRIGRRVVAIAPPAAHVTVQLLPEERGEPIALGARSVDGRRVTATVEPASSDAEVTFPPRATPGRQAPARPKPTATAKTAAPPPLPRSPYGGNER